MIINSFYKPTTKLFLLAYVFAIFMILVLHAALTTITTKNLYSLSNLLSTQIEANIYKTDKENLKENLEKFLINFPAARINVYDNEEKIITSTSDIEVKKDSSFNFMDFIAKSFLSNKEISVKEAMEGKQLIDTIWPARTNIDNKYHIFIKTLNPIITKKSDEKDKINGVVEVFYDVSKEWIMYNNTRYFGILLISVIFFVFYLILDKNVKHALNRLK